MNPGRTLQRVIMPMDRDPDVLALYVEMGTAASSPGLADSAAEAPREQHPEHILGRRSLHVAPGERVSFATYFNAFPASYWRQWTVVDAVELSVQLAGTGSVAVYRSTSSGSTQRVAVDVLEAEGSETRELTFPLTLAPFADGGWYWFDVVAGAEPLVLHAAEWRTSPSATAAVLERRRGSATVTITTFNRPSYLLGLLRQLAAAPEVLGVLDEVLVVDQGSDRLAAQAGFAEVKHALGGLLRVVEQANLGGSGGFSRGMSEVLQAARSDYVLLLDDDVSSEPESIVRAITFADLCRTPTIVGGHMFSLYARSTLHSMGEVVKRWRFWWASAPHVQPEHDFSRLGLRDTPWLHRRVDVDYNGWWMCLLPVAVLRELGLSLPLFIKWDDAEYGLRAAQAGVPTVSLPGVGIWHVPWTEKDDALDWQAYFHQRNRLIVALLHSPYARGGRLVRESANHQIKHLLAMQYSVAELRLRAIEDVLRGPAHLHAALATVLPAVRAARGTHDDARTSGDPAHYPEVLRGRPLRKDREPTGPRGSVGIIKAAALGALRQTKAVPASAGEHPQAAVPHLDAQWWRLASLDSALVSSSDGSGVAWYRRDRRQFIELLRRSALLHERLLREWPQLAESYRSATQELSSQKAWQQTFAALDRSEAP